MELLLSAWLFVATWPFMIGFAIVAVFCEYRCNHKFAAFLTILIGAIAWQIFDVSTNTMIYAAVAYIPIGVVWAIWRWKIYCKRKVQKAIEDLEKKSQSDWPHDKPMSLSEMKDYHLNVKYNVDRLVSWVICWPVSMVERSLGDLIHLVHTIVVDWFGNVFQSISNTAYTAYETEYDRKMDKEDEEKW